MYHASMILCLDYESPKDSFCHLLCSWAVECPTFTRRIWLTRLNRLEMNGDPCLLNAHKTLALLVGCQRDRRRSSRTTMNLWRAVAIITLY